MNASFRSTVLAAYTAHATKQVQSSTSAQKRLSKRLEVAVDLVL